MGSCCVLFPILALFVYVPVFAQIYAFILGMATSGYSESVSVLVSKYFGNECFRQLFSIFSVLTTPSGATSIPLMELAFDVYGSYVPAWIVIAILGFVGGLSTIFAELQYRVTTEKRSGTRLIPKKEKLRMYEPLSSIRSYFLQAHTIELHRRLCFCKLRLSSQLLMQIID